MSSLFDIHPKVPGHCSLIGLQIREVKEQFPMGHPLEGRPLRLGAAFPHGVMVTLLLMSGKHTDISLCADAAEDLVNRPFFSRLHAINCATLVAEEQTYLFRTGHVRKLAEERGLRQAMRSYAKDPPIGILRVRPLDDVIKEELR